MSDSKSGREIGYAVVGLGWISQVAMLPAFANAQDARLTALVSGDEEKRDRIARRYGLDPERDGYKYDEFEACLDREDVDAVYLAVPNHLHREYTARAAARGVHVLCEKPMAVTEEDCRAMIDACAEGGVKLMIAYRLHLDPVHLDAARRAEENAIGPTRLFNATFTQQVGEGDVRLMPADRGGGPLYDIGIYCINAARYLFRAEPEAVWATRASRAQERFEESSEMMSCVLHFPGARLAAFTCSFGAYAIDVFHLAGDDGEIRMDTAFSFQGDRRFEQIGGREAGARTVPAHDQFGPQLDYFSRCIREDAQPEPNGEEGLVDVKIIRALYDSLSTGEIVAVDVSRDPRPTPEMGLSYPAVEEPELIGADEPSA